MDIIPESIETDETMLLNDENVSQLTVEQNNVEMPANLVLAENESGILPAQASSSSVPVETPNWQCQFCRINFSKPNELWAHLRLVSKCCILFF